MPGDLRIGIRLDAEGKGFVGEMRLARRELDKLAGGTRKAGGANAEYNRAIKQSTKTTRGFSESLAKAHGRAISYIGGIGSITLATRSLLRHADAYTQISNAVRIATGSAGEQGWSPKAPTGGCSIPFSRRARKKKSTKGGLENCCISAQRTGNDGGQSKKNEGPATERTCSIGKTPAWLCGRRVPPLPQASPAPRNKHNTAKAAVVCFLCFVSIHAPREGRDYATENKLTATRKREK